MDTVTWVQILDEVVCISHSANILWKGIHPPISSLFMARRRLVGQTGILILVWQPVQEKENSPFKHVKLGLKLTFGHILLVWMSWYIYIWVSSDTFRNLLLTLSAGNCRRTTWPRPSLYTNKVSISRMARPPNIRLKFSPQKVTGYAMIYVLFFFLYMTSLL